MCDFESEAKQIIVVEKDAVFQRLIDERIFEEIGSTILITGNSALFVEIGRNPYLVMHYDFMIECFVCTIQLGKGYPDLVTLKMIRKLKDALNLKVFAFVDCDAYGVEIASVIRWGSYKQASIGKSHFFCPCTKIHGRFSHNTIFLFSAKCTNDWSIAEELTVPDLVWLGLLPSEITDLSLHNRAASEMTILDRYKVFKTKQRILSNVRILF